MAKTVSIFNNKGGVGKTTYMYHISFLLAGKGIKVLMVDCDSQCNLTAYALEESVISKSWAEGGNSIYRAIEPVHRGIGDIRKRSPLKIRDCLYMIPGDLYLSNYEDVLGDSWNSAKGGSEPSLRIQSAIYRYIKWAAEKIEADIILVDLGPNLGALNRSVLAASDYFIIPVSPDLFSIRGTENLGSKLVLWRKEWDQCNEAWSGSFEIPKGKPTFLGYVIQHHNARSNKTGMTKGWKIFGDRLEKAIRKNIVNKMAPLEQVIRWEDGNYNLGRIPNLHSLIPYSLEARKPVFECSGSDGLTGTHITTARESAVHFEAMVNTISNILAS